MKKENYKENKIITKNQTEKFRKGAIRQAINT